MGLVLQVIWQVLNLCIIGAAFAAAGSSGSVLQPPTVAPSTKSPPFPQGSKGPLPFLSPRQLTALPPEHGSAISAPTQTPHDSIPSQYAEPPQDSAPLLSPEPPTDSAIPVAKPPQNSAPPWAAETPYEQPHYFIPPPVSDSPLDSAAPPAIRPPKDATPPSVSVPSHASPVPLATKPPEAAAPLPATEPPHASSLEPPVEPQPFSATPPSSEGLQQNSTLQSPSPTLHMVSPPSQLGPSHASSSAPIIPWNASVSPPFMLPLPLDSPPISPSAPPSDEPPAFEPPPPATADPPVFESPPAAADRPVFEPPPPSAADAPFVSTQPLLMPPSHSSPLLPGTEAPNSSTLPLAAKPPDAAVKLPAAESPQVLPLTPPPELQPAFPSPPPALTIQSPPMPENASSAPSQLAPPTASPPLPHLVVPILFSPPPQMPPQNAPPDIPELAPPTASPPLYQLLPPVTLSPLPQLPPLNISSPPPQGVSHASPQIPVVPPVTSFLPPIIEPPPAETPTILPSASPPVPSNTSSLPPQLGPPYALSPPFQLVPPSASPPTSTFPSNHSVPPPLIEPPSAETPPILPSVSPPLTSNSSSLPPQLGPPYALSPPFQLFPPSASPPTSAFPSNYSAPPASTVSPFVEPPPLLPPPFPAVPPHGSAMLSPPMPSHALSPQPLLVPPHSLPPPLAEAPHVFSAPPPLEFPHTSPPSFVLPRAVPPHASSPLHLLMPPFVPPPPAHTSVSPPLMVPPPSEPSHSPVPPAPTMQGKFPAVPPHSSQRKEAQDRAPPPLLTSPEPSHLSRTSPRAATPVQQIKPGTPAPTSHQIGAPKHNATFSKSNASEPHAPSLTAPAPSNKPVQGIVQPVAPPGRAPEQSSPAKLSPFHAPKFARQNETSPAPLFQVHPPSSGSPHAPSHSLIKGSSMAMVPLSSPSGIPRISPAPSPIPRAPPAHSETRNTKRPLAPPIRSLPPPPPNADCAYLTCPEPYTSKPPGSPCGCVWPMQAGLRLSVALFTFFPLASELAREISIGVFLKESQVRIMGATEATQDPEKSIVLVDLVPLNDKFDNITSSLIFQKFWNKQVVIKESIFGDYDVLYVRYPGLPPSPPMAPADIAVIDSMPYSVGDPNKMHPLGVDVTKQRHKHRLSAVLIAVIVLSATVGMLICCSFAWLLVFRHTNNSPQPSQAPHALPSLARSPGPTGLSTGSGQSSSLSFGSSLATYTGSAKTFSASEIEKSTDNLNPSRILGEGGFGLVYSGVLEDETRIAVKVLKRDDQQSGREFLAEVEMLSRLHHRNLVKLIGICTDERIRCLVYELIPNGSVESHLHGTDKEIAPLDWTSRLKIALGAARGLAYLHEDSSPRVIHRDFKASNILLENDFTPKVSDFGLARTAMDEENRHISTRVMGTFGYVAPEYAMTGHLLVKSDVYSYGVVLLELLTGKKPVDMLQPAGQENLVAWTRPLLTSKEGLESIIDPSLGSDVPFESVAKVAAIASMCVQPEVSHRPFMGEVVQALKLVCNECDDSKDGDSRSHSQENLSMDFDAKISPVSGTTGPLEGHFSLPSYVPGHDVEKGLSVSEIFSASATLGTQASGSFRRHSASGPIGGTVRERPFWQRIRRMSHGSVSEHGIIYRLWAGSH